MNETDLEGLRLAIFSPVPPAPSGIADYVADLLPLLPDAWEIDLFVDQSTSGVDAAVAARGGVHPHGEWRRLQRERPYDLQIYQAGNGAAHAYILPYVVRTPGLLVLHDAVLHASRVADYLRRADVTGYRSMARVARPDVGRALGHLVAGGLAGSAVFRAFPLCEDLVAASRCTVVHGEPLAWWLRSLAPGAEIGTVAHWRETPAVDPERVAEWRQRLGARDDRPVIGTFGHIGAAHRLDLVIEALGGLAPRHDFRLVVAGAVDASLGLERQARTAGIGDRIHWAGRLPAEEFGAAMRATDLALNLRYPTARSSSGTMQQLMQLGVPLVVHDLMHLSDLPADAVARVPTGPRALEVESLTAALENWLAHPAARRNAGEVAAAWAAREITPEAMRSSYVAAIARAIERRPAA